MKTYELDVFLKGISEFTDERADALFAAGCDDGTPTCSNGVVWVHFDREAISLENAIGSVLVQVKSVGLQVSKVELDAHSAVALEGVVRVQAQDLGLSEGRGSCRAETLSDKTARQEPRPPDSQPQF